MDTPKWKKFELIVKAIQEQLSPFATVTHNEKIQGYDTGIDRQVDVVVRQKIGQFDILIAIECKDYNHPLDVKDIEAILGELKDIRANKGVIVSAKGFSSNALNLARLNSIDTYRLVDTQSTNWPIKLQIPMFCEIIELSSFQIQFSSSSPENWYLPQDPNLFDEKQRPLGKINDIIMTKWNVEGPLLNIGRNERSYNLYFNCEDKLIPFCLTIWFDVKKPIYFKNMPIEKLQGFVDEQTGRVITKQFQTEKISLEEIEKIWNKVKSTDSVNFAPKIIASFIKNFDLNTSDVEEINFNSDS